MADNVTITQGTGTTVATDDVGGVQYQKVKLVDGTADASTAIAAGGGVEAGALRVTIASDSTGVVSIDDNGGAITVDGTVAVTNAGITSIDSKITACNTGDVTVAASALPTGAATSAKQDTGNTSLSTIAGAVAGTEMQVDVLTMPTVTANATLSAETTKVIGTVNVAAGQTIATTNAGTFAVQATLGSETTKVIGTVNVASGQTIGLAAGTAEIGKLAAGTANIGDVDVLSLPAIPAGTNNIGDVDIASIAAGDNNIGNVDIASAIPAGTNNIGDVDVVSFASGKTIKRAAISAASSGDNTLVAAVADKKIKVLSVCLVATAAVTVRFESGAGGTALSGVISLDAKSGFVLNAPADPSCHWMETGVNTLLNLELGGAVQVSGMMTYYEEA